MPAVVEADPHIVGFVRPNLDNLITLHQRNLEALRNLKAALLDKMFA